MFIHCGGKDRIPVVVDALKNLDVPVHVICDFDVLNAEKPLCDICAAIGIKWEEIKGYWRTVTSAVDDKKPDLETEEVEKEIRLVLDSVKEKYFPKHAKKQIYAVLRRSSP